MNIKSTNGDIEILMSDVKTVKQVVKTRTPQYDSYDVIMKDGASFDVFESIFPREAFLKLLPRDNVQSTKKILGLF